MKIFISHSSEDKPFVEKVINEIGYDWVIFDKYSFEAGQSLTDSIRKGIEDCDIFVLLISQHSIGSIWVQEELNLIAPLIVTKGTQFLPYCIDDAVKMKDERLQPWVWDRLVVYYPQHKLLARVIQREIKSQIWKKYPEKKEKANLFIGRNTDMGKLENAYFQEEQNKLKAVFVSGFPLVGRKTLLRHFVNRYLKQNENGNYQPIYLNLKPTDSIEQLALQLNEYVGLISNEKLLYELSEGKEKTLKWCSKIIKILLNYHERVIIEDDACIVKPGGGIEEWFLDIIHTKNIPNATLFFVASRFRPRQAFVANTQFLMEMPVSTLNRDSMYNLFKGCLSLNRQSLEKEDMDYFVNYFTGYPKQAIDMADYICSNSLISSKSMAKVQAANYDGNFNAVMVNLSDVAKDMLILLAKFDFISCDLLQEIYGNVDISNALNELNLYSLYDMFGLSNQYISLNHSVADYIVRTRQKLSSSLNRKLQIATKRVLSDVQNELTDLSSSLLNIRQNIRNNITRMDERYLIPSFVLKVIVEEYHAEKDKNVVDIAMKLIHDYKKVNYDSCINAIHYWMCCSLCRLQDKETFEKEINYFKNSFFDYFYLKGFYRRHSNNNKILEDARFYYEKALGIKDSSSFSLTSIAKVEHEMVIVLTKMEDYKGALSLAKRNYENNPHNSYHIRAYFTCLAFTSPDEIDEMSSLVKAMMHTQEKGVYMFASIMKAVCRYYDTNDLSTTVAEFRRILSSKESTGMQYAKDTFKKICRSRGALKIYDRVLRETGCNIVVDDNEL